MADKSEKKEVEVVGIEIGAFIALAVVIAAWPSISEYLLTIAKALGLVSLSTTVGTNATVYGSQVITVAKSVMNVIMIVSFPVSLFFLIGIVYSVEQLKHIRKKEAEKYDIKVEAAYETNAKGSAVLAERWEKVQNNVNSENPSDWRQAILDADIMLEDVLTILGYQGEGVGEKLRRVEKGDMKSLNEAGEAHGVRNRVAHGGSAFPLTKYEAQNTINKYKKVFEEFYYI